MTNQSNSLLIKISKQQVEDLLTIQDETLAVSYSKKTFRTVDLWNIQRQKKVRLKKRMPGQTYL